MSERERERERDVTERKVRSLGSVVVYCTFRYLKRKINTWLSQYSVLMLW